ncbi:MurR/RpiR family transcriptional regulator [Apirhabdus apintestini]|nr:MurR/RpiR family transcriptional regulator [Enterobacteriaceae bacterium CA-0114]
MNCLTTLRQRYDSLTPGGKKLADYVLDDPARARHFSSQQLAQAAGVSQSSVVKFAQHLGYKGFPSLKIAISDALGSFAPARKLHNHILADDPLRLVGEKLIQEKTAAMRATLEMNDEATLQQAITLITNAKRILLTGIGASGLVAKDLAWKLMKIGIHAGAEQDMHALLAASQAMREGDLLLAVSSSGERREINLAAQETRRAGAQVLAITGFTPNTLRQCASACLFTGADDRATRSAAISSTSAQMMLTDLLFMALIQHHPDHAAKYIRHSEALVRRLGE